MCTMNPKFSSNTYSVLVRLREICVHVFVCACVSVCVCNSCKYGNICMCTRAHTPHHLLEPFFDRLLDILKTNKSKTNTYTHTHTHTRTSIYTYIEYSILWDKNQHAHQHAHTRIHVETNTPRQTRVCSNAHPTLALILQTQELQQ